MASDQLTPNSAARVWNALLEGARDPGRRRTVFFSEHSFVASPEFGRLIGKNQLATRTIWGIDYKSLERGFRSLIREARDVALAQSALGV